MAPCFSRSAVLCLSGAWLCRLPGGSPLLSAVTVILQRAVTPSAVRRGPYCELQQWKADASSLVVHPGAPRETRFPEV